MFPPRDRRSAEPCPACGRRIERAAAREYDKYGDRWERADKTFEYLCKPCHRALCHQRRPGLEALLVEIGAGRLDRRAFLRRFGEASERSEPPEGR